MKLFDLLRVIGSADSSPLMFKSHFTPNFFTVIALAILFISNALAVDSLESNRLMFKDVWSRVNTAYYDETFGGLDWKEVGEVYENKLPEVGDAAGLRALLREMLNELGDSHFAVLQNQFTNLSKKNGGSGRRGDVGIELSLIDNELFVFRLSKLGAGARAGLREGMRVYSVQGDLFEDLRSKALSYGLPEHLLDSTILSIVESRLAVSAGSELKLEAGWPGKGVRAFSFEADVFEGKLSEAFGLLGQMPIEFETRSLKGDIEYMRFNFWLPALMSDIRPYMQGLEGRAAGLIIDLRGNPGGIGLMATGLAGLMVEENVAMGTMKLRSGHFNFIGYPQANAFSGPVAVLVDGQSLSTSELFVAALQESGRVRVFGSPTPGVTLPSQFVELVNGDVLQMPMANYHTSKGFRVEGAGVSPDESVHLSWKQLKRGKDSVIEAARVWLERES